MTIDGKNDQESDASPLGFTANSTSDAERGAAATVGVVEDTADYNACSSSSASSSSSADYNAYSSSTASSSSADHNACSSSSASSPEALDVDPHRVISPKKEEAAGVLFIGPGGGGG